MDRYSEESMIPKTAIVKKSLKEYLDKVAPVEPTQKNKKVVQFGLLL